MSRIAARFERLQKEGRKALIPFFTAGDPDRASCVPLMHALVAGGADLEPSTLVEAYRIRWPTAR